MSNDCYIPTLTQRQPRMNEFTQLLDQLGAQLLSTNQHGEPEEPGSMVGTVVLVDAETVGRGNPNSRIEAFILAEYDNSIKLRFKDGEEGYYDPSCIIDELGPATSDQYTLFGVAEPEAPPTPDYQTGTYVAVTPRGTYLMEVDRIGGDYYIHEAGCSKVDPLTPEIWECLDNFSDPDSGDNYACEPGPYYVAKLNRMIEVIPHGGYSYYRFIDDAKLTRLHTSLVKDMQRVETDTFEVNAIMVMPTDMQNIEATNKALNNDEEVPTGCCQAAPREE